MAEPASLAIGIAGIATLFDSAVNALEYIHFAKTFGADFQHCQLRLDNACLRLSRWGEAAGIIHVDDLTSSLANTRLDEADLPEAKRILDGILAEIRCARDIEAKFTPAAAGPIKDVRTDLSDSNLTMHKKMRAIIRRRQRHTSLLDKASWAIRERARFSELIGKIIALIDDLEKLFPAVRDVEKDLVTRETFELTEGLRMLATAIKDQDQALTAALGDMLKPVEKSYINNVLGGKQGVGQAWESTITQTFN